MKRITILIITILLIALITSAQEPIEPTAPIPPSPGYMDSCAGELRDFMLYHFGPNCLNPVFWDLAGMPRINTWMSFTRDDGTMAVGMLLGFSWQFYEGRYYYYFAVWNPQGEYQWSFEAIAPERVTQ